MFFVFSVSPSTKVTPFNKKGRTAKLKQNVTDITLFPTEILLKILSYVSTRDLLLSVAKASKKLYALTKDSAVHISVTLYDSVEEKSALQFLEENNCIEELNILPGKMNPWKSGLNKDLLNTLCAQKRLRVLNLETRIVISENQFIKLLQQPNANFLKKIKITRLRGPFRDWNYPKIDGIFHANNLTHIKLGYTLDVNVYTLMMIANIAKKSSES